MKYVLNLLGVQVFFYIILIKVKCSLIVQHFGPFYAIAQYVSVTLKIGLCNPVIIVLVPVLRSVLYSPSFVLMEFNIRSIARNFNDINIYLEHLEHTF